MFCNFIADINVYEIYKRIKLGQAGWCTKKKHTKYKVKCHIRWHKRRKIDKHDISIYYFQSVLNKRVIYTHIKSSVSTISYMFACSCLPLTNFMILYLVFSIFFWFFSISFRSSIRCLNIIYSRLHMFKLYYHEDRDVTKKEKAIY